MTHTKKKILLIDDDPSVSAALLMLLKDEFEAYAAGTVREGVELFGSLSPSVVILDLHLPDEHGLEALRSIRKINRSAPVMILTGYATLEVVEESMRLGASDCLHKPFKAAELQLRLRELTEAEIDDPDGATVEEQASSYATSLELADDLVSSAFLHDVSNPLTSLLAYSAILRESANDPQTCMKLSEMIEQNVEYLSALTEQWRAFSDPETLKPEFASIKAIADQAIEYVRQRAEVKSVGLSLECSNENVSPKLNRYAVVRILVNLLQNAIEATPREGGEVRFLARTRNTMVEFCVCDNGSGIPPGSEQKIFQPRYTTKKKGTGLGLFIARRIVESANGSISICSRTGRGTTFTVQLPVS